MANIDIITKQEVLKLLHSLKENQERRKSKW